MCVCVSADSTPSREGEKGERSIHAAVVAKLNAAAAATSDFALLLPSPPFLCSSIGSNRSSSQQCRLLDDDNNSCCRSLTNPDFATAAATTTLLKRGKGKEKGKKKKKEEEEEEKKGRKGIKKYAWSPHTLCLSLSACDPEKAMNVSVISPSCEAKLREQLASSSRSQNGI